MHKAFCRTKSGTDGNSPSSGGNIFLCYTMVDAVVEAWTVHTHIHTYTHSHTHIHTHRGLKTRHGERMESLKALNPTCRHPCDLLLGLIFISTAPTSARDMSPDPLCPLGLPEGQLSD